MARINCGHPGCRNSAWAEGLCSHHWGKSPLWLKWEKVDARYLFFNEQRDLIDFTDDLELVWHLGQEYADQRHIAVYIFNKVNDEISGVCNPRKKMEKSCWLCGRDFFRKHGLTFETLKKVKWRESLNGTYTGHEETITVCPNCEKELKADGSIVEEE